MTQEDSTIEIPPGTEELKYEWEAPEPLNAPDDALPYPVEGLPEEIGAAVRELQSFTQAPPAMVACSALAVLSLAGQATTDIRRDEYLEGPTSLYFLILADSGERKTTIDGYFTNPIRQKEAVDREKAAPVVKQYMADSAAWGAEKSGVLSKIQQLSKSGKDTNAEKKRLADIEKAEPESPLVLRLLYQDATPEALAFGLKHQWPSGGIVSSEAGIVLGGHAMGKDSIIRNLALLNSLWDGTPISIDRRQAPSYTLMGTRLTMGLAVQPATLTTFIEQSNGLARGTGFLARFLLCHPESTQGTRSYKKAPKSLDDLNRFNHRITELMDNTPEPSREKGLSPCLMTFDTTGTLAWIEAYNKIESDLGDGGDLRELRDVASKAADNIARLAALFALYKKKEQVSREEIEGATVIIVWHLFESRRIFRAWGADPETILAGKLNQWLLDRGEDQVAKSDILQSGPNPLRKKEQINLAIGVLERLHRIRLEKVGRKEYVVINPALRGGE